MKDSSVGPAGLFDPRRQRQLLFGLNQRLHHCVEQQQQLQQQHVVEREKEEQQLETLRSETIEGCRQKRRQTLRNWDDVEEQLTCTYEAQALEQRKQLHRLAALYRRQLAEEIKAIDRKVDARRQAVLQQYENRKNQPGQQQRKEHQQIDEALAPIRKHVEWARALTIRRLDRLPEVSLDDELEAELHSHAPQSVKHALERIAALTRRCDRVVAEMQAGAASKIVDSFYLPAGVAVLVIVWAIVAFFVAPWPPWLWMALGIIPAGTIGFTAYLILLWPLKRLTRQIYPRAEGLWHVAEQCAVAGRKISSKQAAETSAELVQRRDAHLEATERWKQEQTAQVQQHLAREQEVKRQELLQAITQTDQSYTETFARTHEQMRHQADRVAENISQELAETDQQLQQRREHAAARRYAQLQHVHQRWQEGVSRALQRIVSTEQLVSVHFPTWAQVVESSRDPVGEEAARNDASDRALGQSLDFLPLGMLRIEDRLRKISGSHGEMAGVLPAGKDGNGAPRGDGWTSLFGEEDTVMRLPVALHRRLHSGLVIRAARGQMPKAIDLAHQVMWRLLSAAPPSRAKLTLIDPLGRGQHFTGFMALADHDPSIVGHRVWTTGSKIEARLEELAQHAEDVLQSSLRDRFERIEDYNAVAGTLAEPYRLVAAVGMPEALSREAYRHLMALLESGLRCGVFCVLVCEADRPWPSDMPMPASRRVLQLEVDDAGQWHVDVDGLRELPFEPAPAPPPTLRTALVENIGTAAVAASRVEIPLENLLSAAAEGKGSTADDVDIVIGSQGGNRDLRLRLGEGVRQHVLIAGKTGSGKSTLLHSIITSGAHRYRPDQLQFYLLDFKKGVEFKPYAESGLPHARVIGIESEREFGRSVLQRLDQELQQRGERFRAAGVQHLDEFRRQAGESMPRLMLVVDEFQELFVRDDRLASECAMLLDRLVRQGRSFGMHVVLSSQSLAGAYSLPRATLGQMAVRIAMQCSESDAALILSDDNTAARLISRPGEAIYNDAGGLIEGNQPFQVAWLSSTRHREMLDALTARDDAFVHDLLPVVVFEGNRPCHWTPALADAAAEGSHHLPALLGESVEIGPPVAVEFARSHGRNMLIIASPESRQPVIASMITRLSKSDSRLQVHYLNGLRVDDGPSPAPWLVDTGVAIETVKPRDSEAVIQQLAEVVESRSEDEGDHPPVLLVIDPLERFRDLRQDDSFSFSLDAASGPARAAAALQRLLRDGPAAGVFALVACTSAETLSRWLPRSSHHDLELRVLGQMNAADSSLLIDSPAASDLSAATMLLYDDSEGRISKFRQTDLPASADVRRWLQAPQ